MESLRVLVVDDCPDNAYMLSALLGRLGCLVQVAHHADKAFAAAIEFRPQVAMLDIAMPGCDGYQLARLLQGSDATKAIRLIAVSGYADEGHRNLATQSGFDAYIVKPYTMDELNEVLAPLRLELEQVPL